MFNFIYLRTLSKILFTVICIILYSFIDCCNCNQIDVTIEQGTLRGLLLKSRDGRNYSSFLGVPYVQPPQRFKVAEPPKPWEGILNATEFGEKCVQRELVLGDARLGSEDCLFINIFSPNLKGNYPVMVFLHGGAFSAGSSNEFGGKYFMDEDVILVTLNYRLSAFGFLNTNDGEVEGNLGLKDQVSALQWVQKNIGQFGGDPKQVTLFGASAGAAAVDLHLLSPMSKGLFHKGILQSGAAMNYWAFTENPVPSVYTLGKALGCPIGNTKVLIDCLRNQEALKIVNKDLSKWYVDPLVVFPPSLDVPGKSSQIFLPKHPREILKSGKYNKMPLLFLICPDEGLLLHSLAVLRDKKLSQDLNENWKNIAPITFGYEDEESLRDLTSVLIRQFYFGQSEINEDTFRNLTNLYSDRFFLQGVYESIKYHRRHNLKIFTGMFSYIGDVSTANLLGQQEIYGVTHGDERIYQFNNDHFPEFKTGSRNEQVSKSLVKLWVNFAKDGEPGNAWENTVWNPLSKETTVRSDEMFWFNLNFPPSDLKDPYSERMQLWEEISQLLRNQKQNRKDEL